MFLSGNRKEELIDDNTSDNFSWLGKTEFNEYIVGKEKTILLVAARISGPGAYDVSARVKLTAFDKRKSPIETNKGECVIVVN